MSLGALLERQNKQAQQAHGRGGGRGKKKKGGGFFSTSPLAVSDEQTVYTVETTLTSIRKEDEQIAGKKSPKNRQSRKKRDCLANKKNKKVHFSKTIQSSSEAEAAAEAAATATEAATGAANDNIKDTSIQCRTKIVPRFDNTDGSLWYTKQDVKNMRQEGLLTAYAQRDAVDGFCLAALKVLQPGAGRDCSQKNGTVFMQQLAVVAECRGLEHLLAPQIKHIVQEQIQNTLAVTSQTTDTAVIRLEARRVSKRCAKMARQLAVHDAKEALRASFTSWQSVVRGGGGGGVNDNNNNNNNNESSSSS